MYYKQVHTSKSAKTVMEICADKPFMTRPKTVDKIFLDGKYFYIGETGKQYEAEAFDNFFQPKVKSKQVKTKAFKGRNSDKTKAWMHDEYSY